MKYIGIDLTKHFRYAMQSTGGKPFVFSPTETGLSAFEKWLREISDESVCVGLDSNSKTGRILSEALHKSGHQIRNISNTALNRARKMLPHQFSVNTHNCRLIAFCAELGHGEAYVPGLKKKPAGFWAFHPSWIREVPQSKIGILFFSGRPGN